MSASKPSDDELSPRGSAWTLIAGFAVFGAILLSVYMYVFPRLGQEPISATAALEFRESSKKPREMWDEMILPNGETRYVSNKIALNAADFRAFQSRYNSQPPEILLILSDVGLGHLHEFNTRHTDSTFVVRLHGKVLAEVTSNQWSESNVTMLLRGMSDADGNEVLARLTE